MRANVIGRFDQLLIAEAVSTGTLLDGKSLSESRLREVTGVTVVGLWNRGQFQFPHAHTRIAPNTVLVLAGSEAQFHRYDELMSGERSLTSAGPVLILGAGRVGRAAAEVLEERKIDYRIVENDERAVKQDAHYILGSAADRDILVRAGIREAPTVIVTTHSDDLNIYLTIFCHRLRPELQVISRATLERNVSTLHRAGADMVMSYASMAASTILDVLRPNQLLLLEEGLEVFRTRVHPLLGGMTLRDTQIRELTGCNVIAINSDGRSNLNPDPSVQLRAGDELILIGTSEAEESFIQRYPKIM
jgi:Trk K+ transport system NAD-binding subunit